MLNGVIPEVYSSGIVEDCSQIKDFIMFHANSEFIHKLFATGKFVLSSQPVKFRLKGSDLFWNVSHSLGTSFVSVGKKASRFIYIHQWILSVKSLIQ